MIRRSEVAYLPASAQDAVLAAAERVARANAATDNEATIGASKDLIECVAKAALDALGSAYGSNIHVDKLAAETLSVLKRTPALQGRAAIDLLGSALINAATAVAQLRNTDGTGHGRASRSKLDPAHVELARAATEMWCRWVLASTRKALKERGTVERAVNDIGNAMTFGTGQLAAYLGDVDVASRSEDDQRKLGLAVARRWSENGTFMPLLDVIEPLIEARVEYPPAFCEGLLEGLLLDHNGFLILTPRNVSLAVGVSHRLPGSRLGPALASLVARVLDGQASATVDESQLEDALVAMRSVMAEEALPVTRDAWERMAAHVDRLRTQSRYSGS